VVVLGQIGGGQARGGVVGHEGAQVRGDADGWGGLAVGGGGRDDPPDALGVAGFVEGPQRGQVLAGARVDHVDAGEIPARDAQSQLEQRAVRGRDLEAHALDGDGAVAAALFARDLGAEGAPQGIGAGALAGHGGASQVSRERTLVDLRVLLALVLLFGPGLGGGVEEIEREVGLALEHGQEAPFDLSPERFLFSVLLGRIRQRGVVDDAESLEALDGLGGEHGGAVVGQKRARQSALVKGLREGVDEGLS